MREIGIISVLAFIAKALMVVLGPVAWGIGIAVGFWLANKATRKIDRKLGEIKADSIIREEMQKGEI